MGLIMLSDETPDSTWQSDINSQHIKRIKRKKTSGFRIKSGMTRWCPERQFMAFPYSRRR